MKGFIQVTPDSIIDLTNKCCAFMNSFRKENQPSKTIKNWSFLKFKYIEHKYFDLPFWYQDMNALKSHMHKLHDMADNARKSGDEIYLSALSYCHLVMLSKGDKHANPIYIMRY